MFEQTYAHMEMYGLYPLLQSVYRKYNRPTQRFSKYTMTYHKIPKISPGAYIFQRPLLRGLSTEGNLRFKIEWASPIVGSKFTVSALFYHVFESNCPSKNPRGAIFGGAI